MESIKQRMGIYARVSSQEQAIEGVSIDAQLASLRAYAKSQGWEVVDEYVDGGYSGGTDDRPALKKLLFDANQRRFNVVAVCKLDRFFRNLRLLLNHLHNLEELGIKFVSTQEGLDTSAPYGKFAMQIMGVIAEFERGRIGERVRDARHYLTSHGYWPGGRVLYGYRWKAGDHKWEVVEEEAKVARYIYDLYLNRRMGMIAIAIYLNKEGFRTRDGAIWRCAGIRQILTHPGYKGKHRTGIVMPAIIDEERWRLAQEKRESARHVKAQVKGWLLQGMVICGKCGHALKCIQKRTREPRYYVCRGRASKHLDGSERCSLPWIKAEELEWAVWRKVKEALQNPDRLSKYMEDALASLQEQRKGLSSEALHLDRELAAVRKKLERLGIAYADGTISEDTYHLKLGQLRDREVDVVKCQRNIEPATLTDLTHLEDSIKTIQDVLKKGKLTITEFGIFAMLGEKYVPVGFNAYRETDGEYAMGELTEKDTFKFEGISKVMRGIAAPVGFYKAIDPKERAERIKRNMRAILELFDIKVHVRPDRIEVKGSIPEQVIDFSAPKQPETASIISSASLVREGEENCRGADAPLQLRPAFEKGRKKPRKGADAPLRLRPQHLSSPHRAIG